LHKYQSRICNNQFVRDSDQAPFKFNGKIEGARVEYLGSPAQLEKEKLQTDWPIPAAD